MIDNVRTEKKDWMELTTGDIFTGVELHVCAGSAGTSGFDSTPTYVSIENKGGARFEANTYDDGFELNIYGDFELDAFAQAFQFIADVLKRKVKNGYDEQFAI